MSLTQVRFPLGLFMVWMTLLGERVAMGEFVLGKPTRLGAPISTTGNDHAPDLTGDGLTMFFDRGTAQQCCGGRDIVVSTRESIGSEWTTPQPLDAVNTTAFEVNPSISDDGHTLVFSDGFPSNTANLRPNGLGGSDIWISRWNLDSSSWSEPENIGEPINSRFNDYGPEFSADNLSLYFSSSRRGGFGSGDIWVSKRNNIDSEWMQPINLGPQINGSGNDDYPSISRDERVLIFTSTRPGGRGEWDLWISTRDTVDEDWREPVNLGSTVNTSAFEHNPEISADGSTLLFSRCCGADLWQVPLLPLETVLLRPGSDPYLQDFDNPLSTDAGRGKNLPTGWAITDNDVVFEIATTDTFPESSRLSSRSIPIYNAGHPDDADRALTIGVRDRSDAPILQFLTEIEDLGASGFQLQFDVEAWDAERDVTTDGEAAFDVTVELNTGDGFSPLVDFGRVTTGPNLVPPPNELLDGNANGKKFNSGPINADIPHGSQLRFRWTAATDVETTGWIFGLDNISLSLFGGGLAPELSAGDADQDLDFDQLDLVQVQVAAKYLTGQVATWGEGDWDGAPGGSPGNPPAGDGLFNQFDIIAAQLAGTYLTGPFAAVKSNGTRSDGQTSVIYDAGTGEVAVDAPAGIELTSINMDSAAGIFTGAAAQGLGGSFDNDADGNIFKATFGGSFGSLSFGNVAEAGLSKQFVLGDLSVVGSLAGGGDLGNVDLIYVPEPASVLLLSAGLAIGLVHSRRVDR